MLPGLPHLSAHSACEGGSIVHASDNSKDEDVGNSQATVACNMSGSGSRNHLKHQFAKSTSWETKGTKTSTLYTSSRQVSTSSGEVLRLKYSKIKRVYSVMSQSIKRSMDASGTVMFVL